MLSTGNINININSKYTFTFCTYYCVPLYVHKKSMNDIQSYRNLILNYPNFTHPHVPAFIDEKNSNINPDRADLIGLFYRFGAHHWRVHPISDPLSHYEEDKQRPRKTDDCGTASAISRRISLPSPLNARFNLHLYCINSKERLRDKGEEGIDGGSTIKAIKIVTDTGRSGLSLRASNFLNYIAENAREKLTETSAFSIL